MNYFFIAGIINKKDKIDYQLVETQASWESLLIEFSKNEVGHWVTKE